MAQPAAKRPVPRKAAARPAARKRAAAKPAAKAAAKPAAKAAAKPAAKAAAKPIARPTAKPVPKTAKTAKTAKAAKPVKPPKAKLVRDSFTMPADEYAVLAQLKQRALAGAHPIKKSELLRAGVKLLAGLGDAALLTALKSVPAVKTGRPKSKKTG